ncbi:MAG TPA: IclR family transcriptional regulator [Bryobacteraceae bacterium]|nr:IclR family transcriptional regulator [Bryobacteraceae bacterium]
MKERDQYFSRAVEKALAALECVRKSPQPMTLAEISAAVKLTKASGFRLVYTLEALGHLAKTTDGRYFAPAESRHQEMVKQAAEPQERLSMEFCETASLAGLFENHIEVLSVFESTQLMRMGNTVGRILPPNASSLGKAITAFQPPEIAEKLVRSYGTHYFTPNTITDEIALREEFAQVRERGFAEDLEESIPGGRCFAAPVLGANGFALGAVSLSMPLIRFKGDAQRQAILTAVQETARAIEKRVIGERSTG